MDVPLVELPEEVVVDPEELVGAVWVEEEVEEEEMDVAEVVDVDGVEVEDDVEIILLSTTVMTWPSL